MNKKPLVNVEGIQVTYMQRSGLLSRKKPFHAVSDATLSINEGETLGLVGESGSGKSSIANAILGLVPVTSGTITFGDTVLGNSVSGYPSEIRAQMQAVFQDPFSSLNPSMSIEDILTEPLKVHTNLNRLDRRRRATELLELVSMSPEHITRHPHQFSGGQRQRIAIAAALALQPKLIVLDEPVSALDVSTQNQIINLLYERQKAMGISYLLIAHDLGLVHNISDHIAVMYLGHIVEQGPSERVYSAPAHPYTKALLESAPVLDPAKQRQRRSRRQASPAIDTIRQRLTGCPYSNRCSRVMAQCRSTMPPLYPVEGGGQASCFLLADKNDGFSNSDGKENADGR